MPPSRRTITSAPVNPPPAAITQIAAAPRRHDNDNPLWQGPCGAGWNGGVTQSMLVRFLSCRERFRLKYVLGLEPHPKWNKTTGYGEMWHVCEEEFAKQFGAPSQETGWRATQESTAVYKPWNQTLRRYTESQLDKFPLQREEITKWANVCQVQFPEYVKFWSEHPDVKNRTPLAQEKVFDTSYELPSGRVVRLRGKWDSVDAIFDEVTSPIEGLYIQENKTRGDIDRAQVERQLQFDLQTMFYFIALAYSDEEVSGEFATGPACGPPPPMGVRYNVVRRPLSSGKGSITPKKATKGTKCSRCKMDPEKQLGCPKCHGAGRTGAKPAESDEAFYERLRRDYIAKEPDYWFFRVRAEISERDVRVFRETCLDPLLEHLCWWYEEITNNWSETTAHLASYPSLHYRTPFGVYSALEEQGSTEYDAFLETRSEAGLQRVEELFTELKE